MRRATVALGVAAALVVGGLASCSSGGDEDGGGTSQAERSTTEATTTTTPIAWPEPTFVEGECPMPLTDAVIVEVTCGTVDVPEDRTDPDSATISLAVAKLHSVSDDPAPDPVVRLEGGPGFSSLVDVANYSTSRLLEDRDYIIWDQRGTGFSEPNLDCPEANEAIWDAFGTTDEAPEEGARIDDALRACRDRLVDEGVDLGGYDTVQNAADLADLRVALGYDEWNLRGVSYGSALAIETVRNHPEGLRSVLLDSVVVPDEPFGAVDRGEGALRAFDALAQACADDSACDDAYGPIPELLEAAATQLDEEPYVAEIEAPDTGELHEVQLVGGDLYAGMFNAMYDNELIPLIPSVLQLISEGDYGILEQLAQQSIPFVTDQVEGMTASVDCADRLPLLDPESLEPFVAEHPRLGTLVHLAPAETGCGEWGVEANGDPFNDLLEEGDTEVPIIVMGGQFDPITPPAGSQKVAEALGQELLLFPNVGHGAVGSDDCALDIWVAFMDDPSATPDVSCMDDIEPIAFS